MSACSFLLACIALAARQSLRQESTPHVPAAFGAQIALLGDLDGDGWSEVAITAPHHDVDRGRVTVFSLRTGDVWLDVLGRENGERLGEALWTDGDLDGDGWNDVVVSVRPRVDGLRRRAARAISSRSGRELFTLQVPTLTSFDFAAGPSNIWLADRDGDGCDEVCAYDPRTCTIVAGRSPANLRFRSGSPLPTRDGRLVAHSLIELGRDVDGDGVHDIAYAETLVTSYRRDLTPSERAEIEIYLDSDVTFPTRETAYRTVYETHRRLRAVSGANGATLHDVDVATDGEYGRAMRLVPDLDGDGIAELAVATIESEWLRGRCVLHRGADFAQLGQALEFPEDDAPQVPDHLDLDLGFGSGGGFIAYDRDLDGDGLVEHLVGYRGRDEVRVVSGAKLGQRSAVHADGVLCVLRPPAVRPARPRDPYALGRPSLNRAGRP